MSLILSFSIIIRLVAMGWSIILLRSMRNWRMGFLTVMLGLMAMRQTLTLLTEKESWVIYVTGLTAELPGLIVSIMTFLAIFFLERSITEQRRARQALQESEERYRMLFNSGNDALFIHQLTKEGVPGKFIEVNNIACRRLGYTKEELLRLSPVDIVVPEKLGEMQTIMENIITSKHSYFEIVHLSKDGKEIPGGTSIQQQGRPTASGPSPSVRGAGSPGYLGSSGLDDCSRRSLLMVALPMIAGVGPASEAPSFRWKPSVDWLFGQRHFGPNPRCSSHQPEAQALMLRKAFSTEKYAYQPEAQAKDRKCATPSLACASG